MISPCFLCSFLAWSKNKPKRSRLSNLISNDG